MDDMKNRFREIRVHLGLSQHEMSLEVKLSKNAWQTYERGISTPGTQVLSLLADMGFSINWLVTGKGSMRVGDGNSGREGYVFLHRYGPGGPGDKCHSVSFESIIFDEKWLHLELKKSASELCVLIPESDSMLPTIVPGDVLILDQSKQFLCGDGIYVFCLNGVCQVKRIQIMGDGALKIMSDNPLYETILLSRDDVRQLVVLGKIIWRGMRI